MTTISAEYSALIDSLVKARINKQVLLNSPEIMGPDTAEAAYFIQDQVAKKLDVGPVRAWKLGARSLTDTPYCAPIYSQNIFLTPLTLKSSPYHAMGMEAELCFVLGQDLPARQEPYSLSDLAAAIDRVEVAMELVDSRLDNWQASSQWLKLADNQMNGALILGDCIQVNDWKPLDFSALNAELYVNEQLVTRGPHILNDPISSLPWLANHLAARQGGMKQGDRVITGTWTGMTFVSPGDRVRACFAGVGEASVQFLS